MKGERPCRQLPRCGLPELYGWMEAAMAAAIASGMVDAARFSIPQTRRVLVLPMNPACNWAGIASVGCGNWCLAAIQGEQGGRSMGQHRNSALLALALDLDRQLCSAPGYGLPRTGPQLGALALDDARAGVRRLLLCNGSLRQSSVLQRAAVLAPGLVHNHRPH